MYEYIANVHFYLFLKAKTFSRVPADHTNLRINSNVPDFNGMGVVESIPFARCIEVVVSLGVVVPG